MSYDVKLQKAWEQYRRLADRAAAGDRQAHADKAKARLEAKQIEREAAKEGQALSIHETGKTVKVTTKETPLKRELQGEYCRKFDNTTPVAIAVGPREAQPVAKQPDGSPALDGNGMPIRGKVMTLRQHHTKRLLGKDIRMDDGD